MVEPAFPGNEAARLRSLLDLKILDTEPEAWFDELTNLASTICETPIAAVSLIDEERQWFKASVGLDFSETSRAVSFCGHTILKADILEVKDTHQDPRFYDNPLVQKDNGIRFYAGAPLQTVDGQTIGSLCVIDSQPRQLTDHQRQALRVLADQVELLLEMRRSLLNVQSRVRTMAALISASQHFKLLVTPSGRIVKANRAARGNSRTVFDSTPLPKEDILHCLSPKGRAVVDEGLRMARLGASHIQTLPFADDRGIMHSFEFRIAPAGFAGLDGTPLISVTVADVAERHQALAKGVVAAEAAEKATQSRQGRLLAQIAQLTAQMDATAMSDENRQLLAEIQVQLSLSQAHSLTAEPVSVG